MPFPQGVGKLTFSGTHAVDETFSFGFHIVPIVMTDELMDEIEGVIGGYFGAPSWKVSSNCALTEIKYAQLDVDGRYASDDQPFVREVNPPKLGGSAGPYVPQASMVVTLETAKRRGLAHEGRFYMPPTTLQAGANGQIVAGDQDALGAAVKNFLAALNDVLSPSYVVVASSVRGGAINAVTGIRVGAVIDTQRRRRKNIPENYKNFSF